MKDGELNETVPLPSSKGTKPIGEVLKLLNGNESKGPAIRPFSYSITSFLSTISGLRLAEIKDWLSTLTISPEKCMLKSCLKPCTKVFKIFSSYPERRNCKAFQDTGVGNETCSLFAVLSPDPDCWYLLGSVDWPFEF